MTIINPFFITSGSTVLYSFRQMQLCRKFGVPELPRVWCSKRTLSWRCLFVFWSVSAPSCYSAQVCVRSRAATGLKPLSAAYATVAFLTLQSGWLSKFKSQAFAAQSDYATRMRLSKAAFQVNTVLVFEKLLCRRPAQSAVL